ncbi:MAG: hypothetical protein K8M05_26535 [Deltaproteobacteria bacterium]|nr:hypothetical protein [Kofleriaceae bacterium]
MGARRRGGASRAVVAAAAVMVVAACAGEPAPDEPDAAASLAWSVELPPVELAAGGERTVCFYTTMTLGDAAAIRRWESDVSSGAHGLQVLATADAVLPDGTLADTCAYTSGDAPPRLFYTANLARDVADMPARAAMPVPAAQPLVVRLHVINTSDQPRAVVARVGAVAVPAGESFTAVSTFVSHRTDLRLLPGARTVVSGACTLPPGTSLVRLSTFTLGHATATEVHDDSGRLFRYAGGYHPGEVAWLSAPHVVAGPLRYTCEFENPGAAELLTGGVEGEGELCSIMAQVTPADAPLTCVDDAIAP